MNAIIEVMSRFDDLQDEHDALKRQVDALQREHDSLELVTFDKEAHEEHRAKLRVKLAELKAHMARLKSEPSTPN